jgi:hypothetical protein
MLQDHFTETTYEPCLTETEETKNMNLFKSMQDTFKKYKKDDARLKKALDMSSTLQGKDFYENLLQMDMTDKPIKEFEIEVPEIDALNLSQFKKTAAKKGVHVYDIKTESFLNDKDRKVIFKIRENDITDFDKIKSEIESSGLKIKPHPATNVYKKK